MTDDDEVAADEEIGVVGLESDENDDDEVAADDEIRPRLRRIGQVVVGLDPDETDNEEPLNDFGSPGGSGGVSADSGSLWNPALLSNAKGSLDRWAERWSVQDDPYVEGLTEAIRDNKNMTMWASLDPYEKLPSPPPVAGRRLNQITQVATGLRNVLVFVPVAITWWAIGKATSAFGDYKDLHPDERSIAFLDFWRSDSELLTNEKLFGLTPKIQEIAYFDFLLIAVVVALTILAGAIGALAERRGDRQEDRIETERSRVALELVDALENKRTASPETIAGSIATVLNDLVDASREVRNAALQLEQASTGIGSFNTQLDSLNDSLQQLSEQVGIHVGGQIVPAVESLGQSVRDLDTAISSDTRQVFAEIMNGLSGISAGLEGMSDHLERTGASVEFGTKQLRDDLDVIHSTITGRPRPSQP